MRCCWANCSSATCDGSFREKKPSTGLVFFFLGGTTCAEDGLLEVVEAEEVRLIDMALVVSKDWRDPIHVMSDSRVRGRSSTWGGISAVVIRIVGEGSEA